ncbi:MAG: GNAT family N-acetyltransferase [Christensenellaceae bacterium]|jgi:GNAT superfamily N-acetyltransferase|nr:GNAT family N-acetyltransferase [Christensenellaceae bacterium]
MTNADFTALYLRARGLSFQPYSALIDEELSPEYPLCFYEFLSGAKLCALAPGLEDAIAPILRKRPKSYDDLLHFAFEPGASSKKEEVLGYFGAKPASAEQRSLVKLSSRHLPAIAGLRRAVSPREWALGGVDLRDAFCYGVIEDSQLVCAVGAELYGGLAEISVLTHPAHRGRQLAKQAVFELCCLIGQAGFVPLYRCEGDNEASIRTAQSLGLTPAFRMTGGHVRYR